ncbi:MAG: MFS transporter [Thermoguttaceae bacterium]
MSDSKGAFLAYPRLAVAYFMQFAIWGSWAGALGGYAGNVLKLPGSEIGWLYAAIPLGAIISPMFIGPIADRYFAAQKVVALLHLIGGACLLACGWLCASGNQTFALLMTLIMLSGICFMPTIGLINSIVMKGLKSASQAPYVFVFGTIGWIVVNLFIAAFCGGAETPYFFYVGGGISVALALYCLTLPNTPPQGASGGDALGLGALSLFKSPSFLFFAVCVFVASIPACNYFFPLQVPFLSERGYPSPLALTTLNQFSEIFFMAALPFCIGMLGLKWVIVIGMAAWTLRYLAFAQPGFEFAVVGLLLHGFCYSFLYVAAYMYAEKSAPPALKASAQSLMVFLLLGVGQVAGSQLYGYIKDHPANLPAVNGITVVRPLTADERVTFSEQYVLPEGTSPEFVAQLRKNDTIPLPPWHDAKMTGSAWRYLDLAATVNSLMDTNIDGGVGNNNNVVMPHLGLDIDKNGDNAITIAEIEAVPEGAKLSYGGHDYSKEQLLAFWSSGRIAGDPAAGVTRDAYLAAQAANWKNIFTIPSAVIGACLVLFVLFGRNPKEEV